MAEADYTDEIWKTIPFAPDYAVSDHGRVKRLTDGSGLSRAKAGRILKPAKAGHKGAYLHLAISYDGRIRYHNVHRLVALTFLGEAPDPRYTVAHIDGNGSNNRVGNLRWATQAQNHADKLAHGTHDRGSRNPQAKLTEADVARIRASGDTDPVVAAQFGVSRTTVGRIRRRERWAWLD